MKKVISFGWVLMLAVPALAQMAGMPIAGGAGYSQPGTLTGSGGVVIGDDFNTLGVRGGVAVLANLTLFGDVGVLDPDHGKTGWTIQGGGGLTLPRPGRLFDVGLRATLGYAGYDIQGGDMKIMDVMGGVLVSRPIGIFTPYGVLGINYMDTDETTRAYGKRNSDHTDLALAGGLELELTPKLSLYAELLHIDDVFWALGGRFRF